MTTTHKSARHKSDAKLDQVMFALLAAADEHERFSSARAAIKAGVSRREIAVLLGITTASLAQLLHEKSSRQPAR